MIKMPMKRISCLVFLGMALAGCQNVAIPNPIAQSISKIVDGDDDQDGVLNSVDTCPNTPMNEVVDVKGCTLPPACLDCDLPNYTRRLFFNRNESYPTDDVLYEYSTGKAYFNNTQQMEIMVKNYHKLLENHPNEAKKICIYVEGHNSKGVNGDNSDKLSEQRVNTVKQILKKNMELLNPQSLQLLMVHKDPLPRQLTPRKST